MKSRVSILFTAAIGMIAMAAQPALATFHLIQIEQVIGGVNGDPTAQAIQLRMRSLFQNALAPARIRAWDANGLNPVVVVNFGSSVPNHGQGVRVLIASPNFANVTNPTAVPNFVMDNLIPASYFTAGSLTFETDTGTTIYWRLSWGGAGYTGPTTGSVTNDADGEFGPPWPGPLPSSDSQALLFQRAAGALSIANDTDYRLTGLSALFTNNAGNSFTVVGCPNTCGDINNSGGNVDLVDFASFAVCFNALPSSSQACACSDLNHDGTINLVDFATLSLVFNGVSTNVPPNCP